ncbi:MAG: cytochrome c oxidase assembly protein [Micropruina sp.]|nr:cytochrome c oxidase assembly protein [Micropruina sp.]
MHEPDISHFPARTPTYVGMAMGVLGLAVVVAILQNLTHAGVLLSLPVLPGRPTADAATAVVSMMGGLVARLASAAALGLLAAVVAFLPRDDESEGIRNARSVLLRWAVRAGQLWLASALLMTFASPTFVVGVPIRLALNPTAWWTFLVSSPVALAWLSSALAALACLVVAYRHGSRGGAIAAWLVGAAATVFIAVTGNVSVGLDHDWATDAVAVASVAGVLIGSGAIAVLATGAAGVDPAPGLARYARSVPLLLPLAAGYTVAAWQQLAGVSLFDVPFGLPVLIGFSAVTALVVSAVIRLVIRAERLRLLTVLIDVVLLIIAVASLNAAEHLPPPRFDVPQSIQINYLGYEVFDPPTIARVAGLGRPNLLWATLVVVALALYGWGVVRVRRGGGSWPVSRTLFTIAGLGLTGYLAVSGLWEYSTAAFSWHMLVHMTINMMIPVLCALGAPLTLVREASRPRDEHDLARFADLLDDLSTLRPVRILTSVPVVWAAYVFSLFLVYFSPLFPWLMRYHWGHQAMLLYFMATGFAFFNLLLSPAEHGGRLPYVLRFALLISVMPFHAMFAVGIMTTPGLIGEQFYATLSIPWVPSLLADQNTAGQITWFTGEVPAFIAIVMLAAQWFRSDSRVAKAGDRRADQDGDQELRAYNEMLAELAARDTSMERSRRDVD